MRTLSRRLQFFEIKYINYNIDVDEIKQAVGIEFQGPGKLLGYCAPHQKIPELHRFNVPRNLVYDVMADINPEGLEACGGVGQPKRPKRNQVFLASVSSVCSGHHFRLSPSSMPQRY